MSNINGKQPLQLIRFHEGKFEVPPDTQTFLSSFQKPLALISVVGKYRTGKSLFLNKVLLQQPTFTVSPTVNSCTKGLWLSRETISTEEAEILVIDTEGFGAPEETDQYNQKVLLFAMLLSSFFIYNSVGAIDENSLNSLNMVSQIAREILKGNSRDDKADEEAPSFLWLLRDFALNLVDKTGVPIQPRDYLEQALEPQKGSSDAIEGKNKIRRLLKHFFKERDCFTLVRPVESEEHLQNLLFLPDSSFRKEFLEQSMILRTKILKKVKPKRIKGRALEGPLLLELLNSHVEVVNRGELPNFQLSYKHILKVQAVRESQQFLGECRQNLAQLSNQLLSPSALEQLKASMMKDLQVRFRQFEGEREREEAARQIEQILGEFEVANLGRCEEHCRATWAKLYQPQQWSNSSEIQDYFRGALRALLQELTASHNPIPLSQSTSIVQAEEIKALACFCDINITKLGTELQDREKEVARLGRELRQKSEALALLEESEHELRREVGKVKAKLTETEHVKNLEIEYLKQSQGDQSKEIGQLFEKTQELSAQLEVSKNQHQQLQLTYEQSQKEARQLKEDNRLLRKELAILKDTLASRENQNGELKNQLAERSLSLETVLEKEKQLCAQHREEMQAKQAQYQSLSNELASTKEELTTAKCSKERLEQSLLSNDKTLERESRIYEQMFQSLKDSLSSESASRQELIETNKNLSTALKHLQERTEQAQQKEALLKDYKKAVKNSSCLQCAHCNKFFVPPIFLPHLAHCLLAPSKLPSEAPALHIRIGQTLIKDAEGKPFTEYVIELDREGKQWTLHRKYKSFCDLHGALKGALPGVELSQASYIVNPQEASKKSMQIEERRKVLEKYMQDLEKNPFVRGSLIWAQFLEEPEESSRKSTPLKERKGFGQNVEKGCGQKGEKEPTPEQFFKVWNQRKLRGKQCQSVRGQCKNGVS